MASRFENAYCSGTISNDENYDSQLVVKLRIMDPIKDGKVFYIAAAPPDYRATFSGSGLPFATQVQAFQNTPNKGTVEVSGSAQECEINLMTPNSYYVGLGTVYVPPTLYIEYITDNDQKRNISIKLSDGIPYRSLTHPGPGQNTAVRANPMFYATQFGLPVRSQEQVLRDSAYPRENKMAPDFWGLKPPL